jgi:hypothetical protein
MIVLFTGVMLRGLTLANERSLSPKPRASWASVSSASKFGLDPSAMARFPGFSRREA